MTDSDYSLIDIYSFSVRMLQASNGFALISVLELKVFLVKFVILSQLAFAFFTGCLVDVFAIVQRLVILHDSYFPSYGAELNPPVLSITNSLVSFLFASAGRAERLSCELTTFIIVSVREELLTFQALAALFHRNSPLFAL